MNGFVTETVCYGFCNYLTCALNVVDRLSRQCMRYSATSDRYTREMLSYALGQRLHV